MSDHDKGPIDQVKDALGMGDDHDDETRQDRIDVERGAGGDFRQDAGEPLGGIDGAPQASGRVGATGGTGASAALGGAGAGGPIGDDPGTSIGDRGSGAPAGGVRTEYEMGNELDPEHERVAESGVMAERRGDAAVDTWRDQGDASRAPTRGEAASGESPFDERDERL
jgi:hypothetical protein